ncbi:MAG: hypothetical protein KAX80_00620, partial [Planctomycetes bacterium]|nr:hypothetical protein [Planctomycetota bacterium]
MYHSTQQDTHPESFFRIPERTPPGKGILLTPATVVESGPASAHTIQAPAGRNLPCIPAGMLLSYSRARGPEATTGSPERADKERTRPRRVECTTTVEPGERSPMEGTRKVAFAIAAHPDDIEFMMA